jgi:hypothetical protein
MTAAKKTADAAVPDAAELELAKQLAERARAEGLSLTGPGGLLGGRPATISRAAGELRASAAGLVPHRPQAELPQNCDSPALPFPV